ncbi:MAG TPA: hypothetical protein PK951_05355 [Chitinophagaceae bacterium]|nr:hypothetical protein [Chitinophagaceae bacterium]HUM64673.1 hypothetical protein [Chitinophagaceae bacterium]
MNLSNHLIYWIARFPKTMTIELDDLVEALQYKIPGIELSGTNFRGGFEIFIPMDGLTYSNDEGLLRQHYIVITVDSIRNAVRVFIYKEEKLTATFDMIREPFCEVVGAVKEYIKEHKAVDKLLCKFIQ